MPEGNVNDKDRMHDQDEFHNASVVIDSDHRSVHRGIMFSLNVYSSVVAGTPKYCQLKTGSKRVHLKQKTIVDGADTLLCSFIENPTVTDGTTEVPTYNRNRNSTNTTEVKIYSDPTNITGGTVIEHDYLYATDTGSGGVAGQPGNLQLEWILKPNTTYIYKLENLGDGTANFLAKVMWYEQE